MNPFRKLLVVLALVTVATLASSGAAFTVSTGMVYASAPAGVCACCPASAPGGTFVGCYNTINMPPNAVTCVYEDANGNVFAYVSCINKAAADTGF